MMTTAEIPFQERSKPKTGSPIWELAYLYPYQGDWLASDYLALETNRLIEFDKGQLEFLPMPTMQHQDIVAFLYELLLLFVRQARAGKVYFAPLPIRLWSDKYREPDVIFVSQNRLSQSSEKYPNGADLVIEVVSGGPEDRKRDLVTKRQEYAQAGIPEYWIVDPEEAQIIVLTLEGETYTEHGIFEPGEQASSVLLAGFKVAVTAVFAAADSQNK